MRRAASEKFTPRASEQYQPMQTLQAALTVLDVIAKPEAWEDALYRYADLPFCRPFRVVQPLTRIWGLLSFS